MNEWANSYIGLPWIPREEVVEDDAMSTGMDCLSLVEHVYTNQYGIEVGGLAPALVSCSYRNAMKAFSDPSNYPDDFYPVENIRNKDVVLMGTRNKIGHIGIKVGKGVLHSVEKQGIIYTPNLHDIPALGFVIHGGLRHEQC